jgi:aminotransferase EvaB
MVKLESFLKKGQYVLGEEVREFETAFAEYIGGKYCISVANGTDALELAIKSLNLPVGSEVITAANAGMYGTISILNSGFRPKFVDIGEDSYNLDLEKALVAITPNTKAVIYTHLFGRGTNLEGFKKELDKKGVKLIEDCAQSHGCRSGNKKIGTFGDISTFSFYPTKNLGALGDGGAVITNEKLIFENVLSLRQYGWDKKYFLKDSIGRNSRLDELQALFLNIKLPHLDKFNSSRLKIADSYFQKIINKKIQIRKFENDGSYIAHLFTIEVVDASQRNALMSYLNENQIGSDIHYPIPDYKQNPIKKEFDTVHLENTEERCSKLLTIPCYPELEIEKVNFIIEKLNKW